MLAPDTVPDSDIDTDTCRVQIAIAGAGLSGLGMAIALKQEGIDDFVRPRPAAALARPPGGVLAV